MSMGGGDFSIEGRIVIAAVTQGMEQAVGTIKGIEAAAEKGAKSIQSMGERMAAAGKKMGEVGKTMSLAVTAPLIGLGAIAVRAASDLAEATSSVESVFGASASAILDFSKTSVQALGLSKQAALQAATGLGALLTGVGLSTDQSAEFSKKLLTASADLASFHNVAGGSGQVLDQIRAALTGEGEALKIYGININEATVQQELMRRGQDKLTGAQLEAAKVQARYALILKGQGAAEGDRARTSGTLAGQTRTATAALQEAAATIGTVLVPYALKAALLITRLATAFQKLPAHVRTLIVVAGGVAAVIGPMLAALSGIIAIAPAIATALGIIFSPIGLVVAALVGLGIAYKTNFLGFADAVNAVASGVMNALAPVIEFVDALIDSFINLRRAGFDPISAAIYAVGAALTTIGGENTPRWIATLSTTLFAAGRSVRLFVEALRKLGGADSERVHKILNALPLPLAKLLILFGRVRQAVVVFFRAWKEGGALAAFRTIPRSIELIGRTFGNLLASIGLGRVGAVIKTVFADVGRVIGDVVSLVDALVHGRWSEAWTAFRTLAADALRLFLDHLTLLPALLVDVFNAIPWTRVGSALLTGFLAAVSFMVTTGIPWLLDQGGKLIGALLSGMITFWDDTVKPWLGERVDAITGTFTDAASWLLAAGVDLMTGLIDGVSVRWTQFTHYLSDLAGSIPTYFGNAISYLYNAGYNLITGFINGIARRWEDLVHFLGDLARGLPGWIKGPLGIASPSKVFMEIGKQTVEGFEIGFSDSWRDLERAANAKASTFATVATPRVRPPAFAPAPIARTVHAGGVTINVSGAGDPDAVAARVYQQLDGAFRRLEMERRR